MKCIAIVAGGKLAKQFLPDIAHGDYVIGVDRGAYWLIRNGIVPDVAIGDFDSVRSSELRAIKQKVKRVKIYPKAKDYTDTELALTHAIKLRPREVVIYGAAGSRLDHVMATVYLLEKLGGKGLIRDERNEVRLVCGQMTVLNDARYRYVSLLPVDEEIEVTLKGFHYNVSRAVIGRGVTRGVSNELTGEKGTITLHRGRALVIRSRD